MFAYIVNGCCRCVLWCYNDNNNKINFLYNTKIVNDNNENVYDTHTHTHKQPDMKMMLMLMMMLMITLLSHNFSFIYSWLIFWNSHLYNENSMSNEPIDSIIRSVFFVSVFLYDTCLIVFLLGRNLYVLFLSFIVFCINLAEIKDY